MAAGPSNRTTDIEFAVIDTETTLDEFGRSRVLELAVVRVDSTGAIQREFESLVRPPTKLGGVASRVHGIRTNDLARAPGFAQVLGHVAPILRSAVPIAHRAASDQRALNCELEEMGQSTIEIGCTIRLGKSIGVFGPTGNSLAKACARFGIALHGAHTALGDARATAQLLACLLREGGLAGPIKPEAMGLPAVVPIRAWSHVKGGSPPLTRAEARAGMVRHQRERAKLGRRPPLSGSPQKLRDRLEIVEAAIATAAPLDRVKLIQERMDIRVALAKGLKNV